MIETIAACEGSSVFVKGPARSGKTEALVRRCARLLERGVAPSKLLVAVTSASAAQAFRHRLRQTIGEGSASLADGIAVLTALDACVHVLDAPETRDATGRVPRLLNDAEYKFLLEDMKALGLPPRQLRSALERLFERMEKLAPGAQDDAEDRAVRAHLERMLTMREAMLAVEAPCVCANYLQRSVGEQARAAYDFVLCDDFQNLSPAQLACLRLLAGTQFVAAGNPNERLAAGSTWQNPEALALPDDAEAARTFRLEEAFGNPAIAAFADALCTQVDMDPELRAHVDAAESPDGEGVVVIKWNTPEEEIDGVAKLVRAAVDASDAPESRTCVVVPDKRWALTMRKALRRRGFTTSTPGVLSALGGDPRDSERAKALVAYTKLNLLADPSDIVAWRSWCGFDHPLLNSTAWAALENYTAERGASLLDALAEVAALDEEPFPGARILAERWNAGQEFLARNGGRRGFGLMRAVGAEDLPEFAEAERALEGDEDAARVFARQRAQSSDPSFPESVHILRVATLGELAGCEFDNLFVVAAVNGLLPRRDADAERRAFYGGVSKAARSLTISYFAKAPLELAERARLDVSRVREAGPVKVAVVRPSAFLAEVGDACPGTVGGQALLAERGLI